MSPPIRKDLHSRATRPIAVTLALSALWLGGCGDDGTTRPDPSPRTPPNVAATRPGAPTIAATRRTAPTWEAAVASIKDKKASPAYGGLEITPQEGLLPIGQDAASGLWEFVHLATVAHDEHPVPDLMSDGTLRVSDGMGIILVLIPGGSLTVGSTQGDKDEAPVHSATLAPFFIGKYEVTQGQWARITGEVHNGLGHDHPRRFQFPRDSVAFPDADAFMTKAALSFPTETQWEFACNAGATTKWHTGDLAASLKGYAHMRDIPGLPTPNETAPVGSYLPNTFGLYDMHGNVWEWTLDFYWDFSYTLPMREGDAYREPEAQGDRVRRGAGWNSLPSDARTTNRHRLEESVKYDSQGFRAARSLSK